MPGTPKIVTSWGERSEAAQLVGVGGAGDAEGNAGKLDCARPTVEADAVRHRRDRADRGEGVFVARDEQNAILVTDVDGKRHVHGGEDHGVVQRDENQRGHLKLHFL